MIYGNQKYYFMSKCVNNKCNKDPFDDEIQMKLATIDGDFACCEKCLIEFKKQRDEFFENISDDKWYNKWINE